MAIDFYGNMDVASTFMTILLLLTGMFLFSKKTKTKNLPPGPYGLPFVGYIPFMIRKRYVKFQELGKKYGPIFCLKLGSRRVVVFAGYSVMKEAFGQNAFFGRDMEVILDLNKETIDSGALTHLPWKEQRRFTIHVFRDLGFGRSIMEDHMKENVQELLDLLTEAEGKPIFPKHLLSHGTANNISSMVFGKRKKGGDPRRVEMNDIAEKGLEAAQSIAWIYNFPLLRKVAKYFQLGQFKALANATSDLRAHIRAEIKEHGKLLDPNDERDFIDAYLNKMKQIADGTPSTFTLPVLEDMVTFFFAAGIEAVRNTLEWLFLIVAAYPDVQAKVLSEIEEVIGWERLPLRSDQPMMPYTEAVIHETLRWKAAPPIFIPRETLEDAEINGYFIPKGTHVIPVPWAVHRDTDNWGDDVEAFKPERFLTEDGKTVQKPEYYIPFSIGKRACPGSSLAYMEIFLYLAAVLQKFHVKLPEGTVADLKEVFGISITARPQKLHFELRHH